jgi:hypothetical protein
MGQMKNACKILVGKPEGKTPIESGIDGRIILRQMLKEERLRVETVLI